MLSEPVESRVVGQGGEERLLQSVNAQAADVLTRLYQIRNRLVELELKAAELDGQFQRDEKNRPARAG
jgi:hypothetical protein